MFIQLGLLFIHNFHFNLVLFVCIILFWKSCLPKSRSLWEDWVLLSLASPQCRRPDGHWGNARWLITYLILSTNVYLVPVPMVDSQFLCLRGIKAQVLRASFAGLFKQGWSKNSVWWESTVSAKCIFENIDYIKKCQSFQWCHSLQSGSQMQLVTVTNTLLIFAFLLLVWFWLASYSTITVIRHVSIEFKVIYSHFYWITIMCKALCQRLECDFREQRTWVYY